MNAAAPQAPPRTSRTAAPPLWALAAAAALAAGVGLHTRVYDAWYIYEPVAVTGIIATVVGLVAWMLRAFQASRPGLAIIIASTAIGLMSAYLGAGGRLYYLFAAAACIFVMPLSLMLAGIYLMMRRRAQALRFAALALACVVQVVMALGSNILRQHDVAAARTWCDQLAPQIEAFHAKKNYWPADLEKDGLIQGWRPRLLRDQPFYGLTDQEFELLVRCRRPFIASWSVEPIRWFWRPSTNTWKWELDE